MKRMLVKLAMWFLRRNGYVVRDKTEYQLVPDFILQLKTQQLKPIEPIGYGDIEEGEVNG